MKHTIIRQNRRFWFFIFIFAAFSLGLESKGGPLVRYPIHISGEPVFYLVGPSDSDLTKSRAARASVNLRIALGSLNTERKAKEYVSFLKQGDRSLLSIENMPIIELTDNDARRLGYSSLIEWQNNVHAELERYIFSHLSSKRLKKIVLMGLLLIINLGLALFVLKNCRKLTASKIPSNRIPFLKFVLVFFLLGILTPGSLLLVWGSSLAFLSLWFSLGMICGAFLCLPWLLFWFLGTLVIWQQSIMPGRFMQIGRHKGEVNSINPCVVKLSSRAGHSVLIPTWRCLFDTLVHLPKPTQNPMTFRLSRNKPLEQLLNLVQKSIATTDPKASLDCIGITQDDIAVRIFSSAPEARIRENLGTLLNKAIE